MLNIWTILQLFPMLISEHSPVSSLGDQIRNGNINSHQPPVSADISENISTLWCCRAQDEKLNDHFSKVSPLPNMNLKIEKLGEEYFNYWRRHIMHHTDKLKSLSRRKAQRHRWSIRWVVNQISFLLVQNCLCEKKTIEVFCFSGDGHSSCLTSGQSVNSGVSVIPSLVWRD